MTSEKLCTCEGQSSSNESTSKISWKWFASILKKTEKTLLFYAMVERVTLMRRITETQARRRTPHSRKMLATLEGHFAHWKLELRTSPGSH